MRKVGSHAFFVALGERMCLVNVVIAQVQGCTRNIRKVRSLLGKGRTRSDSIECICYTDLLALFRRAVSVAGHCRLRSSSSSPKVQTASKVVDRSRLC